MPAPQDSQLEQPMGGFVKAAQFLGEDAPGMAKALAQATAQALSMFLSMAMVMPGTPAAIDPITGSGATGGPGASQLEGIAQGMLSGQGIRGEDAGGLAKAAAGTIAQAITLFTAQGMAMPGIAIAGFVSAAPGMLMPVPLAGPLEGIANGLLQQNGLRGEDAPGLAKAMAQGIDAAMMMFAGMALVTPGIAAAPGATAAPGRLS
ncbi:MAG: hypothetical protein ACOYOH_00305 [Paracraurococcus sp.]